MAETAANRKARRNELAEASRAIRDNVLETLRGEIADLLDDRDNRLHANEKRLETVAGLLEENRKQADLNNFRMIEAEQRFREGEAGILLRASKAFHGEFDKSLNDQTVKLVEATSLQVSDEVRAQLEVCHRRIDELKATCEAQVALISEMHAAGFGQIAELLRNLPVPQITNNLPELKTAITLPPMQVTNNLPELQVTNNLPEMRPPDVHVLNQVPEAPAAQIQVLPAPVENHVHVPEAKPTKKKIIYDQQSRPDTTLEVPMTEADMALMGILSEGESHDPDERSEVDVAS